MDPTALRYKIPKRHLTVSYIPTEEKKTTKSPFAIISYNSFLGVRAPRKKHSRRRNDPSLKMHHHCISPVLLLSSCFIMMLLCAEGQPRNNWYPGTATWYGDPEGDGSTGGACGYGAMVSMKPLKGRVGAVGPALFRDGKGCGACYKVKCLDQRICSKRAVTVIITDECPGCPSDRTQFDLSGAVFGRLSLPGQNSLLRNRGQIPIIYKRTPCLYGGKDIAFQINEGSTPYWLSLLVMYEDGDGDVSSMQIQEAGSSEWLQMKHLWGANWVIIRGPLKGPFSVKLSTSTGKSLIAKDVIPSNWSPKVTYPSRLHFLH
ncbi:hypothetical protein RJT34_28907 [Clitoria ternatea]|uniref:Uncharacterized protein n=1 Tax=Clitoria ternatea TaxID=43366 RepID=A0AAN9F9E2_CLITE